MAREHGETLGTDLRVAVERIATAIDARGKDVVSAWSDFLTDRKRIEDVFARHAPGEFSVSEFARVHEWCTNHCVRVLSELEARREGELTSRESALESRSERKSHGSADWQGDAELGADAADFHERSFKPKSRNVGDDQEELGFDDSRGRGIDGAAVEESAVLDREDDTLLLLLHQRLRGPLLRGSKTREALVYEHVLVDEAQDYSPVELAVLLGTVSSGRSVTRWTTVSLIGIRC
jgi:DNA helicase-2/ATP-dependent DNA helicase PcrA